MGKNQSGFGIIAIFVAILIVSLVGLTGWYVWRTVQGNKNETTQNQPQHKADETNKQKSELSTTPNGWTLHETTFGDFYFPSNEGTVSLVKQKDGTRSGVNAGYLAELDTYDIRFYDLSNPILQYRLGFFNPCVFDPKNVSLSKTTVTTEGGESFSSTDESCDADNTTIAGKKFLDFSTIYESNHQSGYLTTAKTKGAAILFSKKVYEDTDCAFIVKDPQDCSDNFEKNKTELRKFVEQFIKANKNYFL